jgi:hypothetical protein
MPINSISTNPVSPVSVKGTGSVERPPAVPEASLLQLLPSVIATIANSVEKLNHILDHWLVRRSTAITQRIN